MKYFKPKEFDSPDLPGSGRNMRPELIELLDKIREEFGRPLFVNSGFRTEARNVVVGGKDGSAHTLGLAVDLEITNSFERFQLIRLAIKYGIKRIGVGRTFIHLDIDMDKPQEVAWLYD